MQIAPNPCPSRRNHPECCAPPPTPEPQTPPPPAPPVLLMVEASDYLESFQCVGPDSFTLLNRTLSPGDELRICIKLTSNSFRMVSLDEMKIFQNKDSGVEELDVIRSGGSVLYQSITTKEDVPSENGVYVSPRVPSNLFDYGQGNIITVAGRILTALQRRLKVAAESTGRALQMADDEGVFRLDLSLVDPNELQVGGKPIEPTVLGKSAATANQGIIAMVGIFAVAFALSL